MDKKKIFIVTYGGGHVNIMVPIIKKLLASDKYQIEILALTIAKNILNKHNIEYKGLEDYKDIIADDNKLELGENILDNNFVPNKGITKLESIIYFGTSMSDLTELYGESLAEKIYSAKGKKGFVPIFTMRKIIQYEKPDLIMTGNCPRMELAAVIAGNEYKIPTINIHDFLGTKRRHFMPAKKIAVMSDITKMNLIKQGYYPDSIVVTGQPAFDDIKDQTFTVSKDDFIKQHGLNENTSICLLGTQPLGDLSFEMLKLTSDELSKKDYPTALIIKPHPGEDYTRYNELLKTLPKNTFFIHDMTIRELINISDFMITFYSTIGLESILMKKPLITLNLTGEDNPIPLYKYGVALECTNNTELESAIDKILSDEKYNKDFLDKRLKYFNKIIDGKSTDSVVSLISDILDRK